jgi:hypothetical protein
MNRHLSSEQISEWMLGLCRPEVHEHLRVCQQCSEEVESLSAALGGFRHDVRRFSDRMHRPGAASISAITTWQRALWASVAVALCLMLTMAVWPHRGEPQHEAPGSIEDSVLLRQVSAQLSEKVPLPLEPLALTK